MGLWRGRLTLAILAVLAAGVILLPFFPLASLILWGIFLPLSGAAWFWYFPRLQKSYRLTLSEEAVTLTRGVLIRRQYLLPCPRLIYVEQFSTPLAGLLGLRGIRLRAARGRLTVPALSKEDAAAFLARLGEFNRG